MPLQVHISASVVAKLAVVAGRAVSGVEDVEGIVTEPVQGGGRPAIVHLRLTARCSVDTSRLADEVRTCVLDTVRYFTGIDLQAVEVEFVESRPFAAESCRF